MELMKAIRIHNYGGPEILRYEDAPRPQLGNTTKLPTFFVSDGGGRGHPAGDLDDPGNFSMPAGYAEARNIVFPEMASAM